MLAEVARSTSVVTPIKSVKDISCPDRLSADDLHGAISRSREGKSVAVWSNPELLFLGSVSPSAVVEINRELASQGRASFPFSKEAVRREIVGLAENLLLTIDNSLILGRLDIGVLNSKIKSLNDILVLKAEPCTTFIDPILNEKDLARTAYFIKSKALDILREMDRGAAVRELPSIDIADSFKEHLHKLLGSRMKGAFVYGSSISGAGKDLDLYVVVDDIDPDLYQSLNGAGKDGSALPCPVGIVLIPQKDLVLLRKHSLLGVETGSEVRQVSGLTEGKLRLPVLGDEAIINSDLAKAGKELRSLRGAILDQDRRNKLIQNPEQSKDLLSYILKCELWIARALAQASEGKRIDKSAMLARDAYEYTGSRELPKDSGAVLSMLVRANVATEARIADFAVKHNLANLSKGWITSLKPFRYT